SSGRLSPATCSRSRCLDLALRRREADLEAVAERAAERELDQASQVLDGGRPLDRRDHARTRADRLELPGRDRRDARLLRARDGPVGRVVLDVLARRVHGPPRPPLGRVLDAPAAVVERLDAVDRQDPGVEPGRVVEVVEEGEDTLDGRVDVDVCADPGGQGGSAVAALLAQETFELLRQLVTARDVLAPRRALGPFGVVALLELPDVRAHVVVVTGD